MLSYPPHPAHQQQQATTPMSLAFQAQTQNHHQQQQQVKDEQSAEKAADNEQLQKPLKSSDADIACHVAASAGKDRSEDVSDSNVSDYDYSYDDDDDDEKVDAGEAPMPEALVVGTRRVDESATTLTQTLSGGARLKRSSDNNNDDDDDDDDGASLGDDAQRASKSRRVDSSAPAPTSSIWVRPCTAVHDDSAPNDGDRAAGDATADDRSDESPASPYQTEIKTQRPLGLLAQHRLQTSAPAASYRVDTSGRERVSAARAVDDAEEQRLREMFGRRLTQAELEAAVAMQERMSGTGAGGYCSVATSSSSAGLMTSLPSTSSSSGVGLDYSTARYDSLMDRHFIPSPALSSASPCSAHDDPASPLDAAAAASGHRHWTFQEQFKQLYEMSDDIKRREFLDELFTFMQKRGTPVNRIPIMAKQTLDLYELFRLVVSKGGLVEVINKKLWREITKGLNLPSSITSAAFTLRTQYMKYLYPFECEKLKLSTLAELQYAVDGNRREGRRPSYGGAAGTVPGDFSPLPPPPPSVQTTPGPTHVLHQPVAPSMMPGLAATTPQHIADGLNAAALAAAAVAARTNGLGLVHRDGDTMPLDHRTHQPTVNQLRTLAECDARAMESAARAMQEVMVKRIEEASSRVAAAAAAAAASSQAGTKLTTATSAPVKVEDVAAASTKRCRSTAGDYQGPSSSSGSSFMPPPQSAVAPPHQPPPAHLFLSGRNSGVGAAHIKLTSRNDGRAEFDTSIVASMEVNGIVYQGVLFAQPPNVVGARI